MSFAGLSFMTRVLSTELAMRGSSERKKQFALQPLDVRRLTNPPANDVQVTWIGHASCLVQMDGVAFLTDPVFCQLASPVRVRALGVSSGPTERRSQTQLLGPKRYVPVPFTLAELRKHVNIDFVVISHNHYGLHVAASACRCARRDVWVRAQTTWTTAPSSNWATRVKCVNCLRRRASACVCDGRAAPARQWFVPLGLKSWFESSGVTNVVELDWCVRARRRAV